MRVRFPGQEDPLEKETAVHSSVLAEEIPWAERPGGLESTGSQLVGHDLATEEPQQHVQLGLHFREETSRRSAVPPRGGTQRGRRGSTWVTDDGGLG